MKAVMVVAAVCLTTFGVAMAGSTGVALSFDAKEAKNRPVSKVVTLLKDMLKTLEKEAEEDEEIYDNLACWCETNDKAKTQSIGDAESRISDLTDKIEEYTATSARLTTEIENLEKEVAANQKALDEATEIREKQIAEFNAEEADLLESIKALTGAIAVLAKHNSLIQMPRSHVMGLAASIQNEMQKHAELLKGVLTHSERKVISAFVQAPTDYFDASPTFKQAYAPQSGTIYGILTQMKETFETNLATAQKEELANQKAYEELKAAKEEEIKAGKVAIETKTEELATTDEKNAQAKEDLTDTKDTLAADQLFLMNLKEKCSMTDKEWEERQKTRTLEMQAVSKALAVLSSDDAMDTFTRTFNPSLVQEASKANSERREAASKILSLAANKFRNPNLATLAVKVRLDAFTRVKKAIDDMIAELLQQKEDEIKQKDYCVDALDKNQLTTEKKNREKADLIAKIEDLEATIKALADAIATLKAEISEMQVQMKRAGEDREKENKEFQATVTDQQTTQKLLTQALEVLQEFYGKAAAAMVQQAPAGPAPPPGFKAYEKNNAASGVISLITQIIEDAKAMEAETIKSEDDAQKAYETFVTDTNASIEAKTKDIINKSEKKAKAESELSDTKEAKANVEVDLDNLAAEKADLHSQCDYLLKNFDIRQTARDEEVEALKQAKAILSGAKFEAFLQHA